MKVGLLVIGSEILGGKITDLNTRTLAEFLVKNHLELSITLTVRDIDSSIQLALETLFKTCDVIVTCGGLGPTKDDITKQSIANFLGRKISYSSAAEKVASDNYERFKRPFPGKEHGYSFLPEGFEPLDNSTGFAPAFFSEHGQKLLFSGAGVPREFKSLLDDHFIKRVSLKFPVNNLIETITARTKKIPEEKIFGEIDPTLWNKLSVFGDVSSLPNLLGVDVGVTIKANDASELKKKKNNVHQIFEDSPIRPHIWLYGQETLEEVIVKLANKKKITFGFAESCTGGLCSHRVTNVSGSSKSFWGSVVSYDESVKETILGVSPQTLAQYSAVSVETAKEMASGVAKKLGLDIGISITGLAGPNGGTPEKPVGTVCIGTSIKGKTKAISLQYFGDRDLLKNRFSQLALFTLLEELETFS